MVDVLETVDVPILFSLPQMRNLGMTIKTGSSRRQKLHAHLLACFLLQLSIPRWDILCWMSERKPAYPAHALDMQKDEDEDEDDKPLVTSDNKKGTARRRT